MEKLIKLLNEYDDNNWGVTDYGALFNRMDEGISEKEYLQVISKEYCFIKWLVENDKIDLLKLDNRIALSEFNKVERVLMALSIQDNSIEFLISILK